MVGESESFVDIIAIDFSNKFIFLGEDIGCIAVVMLIMLVLPNTSRTKLDHRLLVHHGRIAW
jgi:hypothetical protein